MKLDGRRETDEETRRPSVGAARGDGLWAWQPTLKSPGTVTSRLTHMEAAEFVGLHGCTTHPLPEDNLDLVLFNDPLAGNLD